MVHRYSHKNRTLNGKVVEHLTSPQKSRIIKFFVICIVLIICAFCAAYFTSPKRDGVARFLGFTGPVFAYKPILVGLVSSTIFGMIDNGGLYFGMDTLDPILPGDELEKAGWGNTFSDFLGAFLGTFISIFVKNLTGVKDTPLFSEVIGIIIGCILGIKIPQLIKGKKSKKSEPSKSGSTKEEEEEEKEE